MRAKKPKLFNESNRRATHRENDAYKAKATCVLVKEKNDISTCFRKREGCQSVICQSFVVVVLF